MDSLLLLYWLEHLYGKPEIFLTVVTISLYVLWHLPWNIGLTCSAGSLSAIFQVTINRCLNSWMFVKGPNDTLVRFLIKKSRKLWQIYTGIFLYFAKNILITAILAGLSPRGKQTIFYYWPPAEPTFLNDNNNVTSNFYKLFNSISV